MDLIGDSSKFFLDSVKEKGEAWGSFASSLPVARDQWERNTMNCSPLMNELQNNPVKM